MVEAATVVAWFGVVCRGCCRVTLSPVRAALHFQRIMQCMLMSCCCGFVSGTIVELMAAPGEGSVSQSQARLDSCSSMAYYCG